MKVRLCAGQHGHSQLMAHLRHCIECKADWHATSFLSISCAALQTLLPRVHARHACADEGQQEVQGAGGGCHSHAAGEEVSRGSTRAEAPALLLVMDAEPLETTLLVMLLAELLDARGAERETSMLVPLPLATPKSTAVGLPSQLPAASTNCARAVPFVKPCT